MPKVNHKARLAELRALRQSGKKAFDDYKVDEVDDIYDNVDEDGYKKLVRERLNQDDFVVDDNGEGYADDGREDWDRVQRYESDSEEDIGPRGRPSKTGEFPFHMIPPCNITYMLTGPSCSQEGSPGRAGKEGRQRSRHQRVLHQRHEQSPAQNQGTLLPMTSPPSLHWRGH